MILGGGPMALLMAINVVVGPGGPGPSLVQVAPPRIASGRYEPQALAPDGIAGATAPTQNGKLSHDVPVQTELSQVASLDLASTPRPAAHEDEYAAQVRQRAKAEKTRKKHLTRERTKREAASRRQDELYYRYHATTEREPFTPSR
jgi:hypothetical protein